MPKRRNASSTRWPPKSFDNSISLGSHWGSLLYYLDNTVLRDFVFGVFNEQATPQRPVNLTGETHQLALLLWLRGPPLSAFTDPGMYYAKKAPESILEKTAKGWVQLSG